MRAIHPALVPWFEKYNAVNDKLLAEGFKQTPINAREGLASMARTYVTNVPAVPWIQDDYVATPDYDVPVRIYHPEPGVKLPVLIYFHGGGHVVGSVPIYDPVCRKLALATRHIVVAPEYRLAPECPYPAGIIDACNVAKYLWNTLDTRNLSYERTLSLAGDSAGGGMSAVVSARAQFDASLDIRRQVLIYPWVDYTMSSPSIEQNATGYTLPKSKIIWFFDTYFAHGEDRKAVSPLFWEFTPDLPETLVLTAEFCPLRDEGKAYADKVRAAGVRSEYLNFDDMPHTFLCMEDLVPEACAKLYTTIGAFLQS